MGLEGSVPPFVELRRGPVRDFSDSLVEAVKAIFTPVPSRKLSEKSHERANLLAIRRLIAA
jgi:hypothetical protein